ncbi:MAG: hypothetical protein ACOX7C_10180 [Brevefilum sp.]|jgi:hypothetical protein
MKQVTNEKLIKRNKTIGNVTTIAGLAILGTGLVLNFNPTPSKTMYSFIALIVGFVVAQISTFYVSKFGRSPRFDEVISTNLSKLNNDYTLYVYSSPVSMLLVGPSGLWIPIPLTASGEIYYDNKWKQRGGSFLLKLFGQESIGRPGLDAQASVDKVTDLLRKSFNENEMPSITSIFVLMNPKGEIGEVEHAPTAIVKPDGLRRHIRKIDRKTEPQIPPALLKTINDLIEGKAD